MFVLALPLLAAITDAGSLILSKLFLRRFGRLTFKEFNWLAFLGIVTVLVVISILFDQFPTRQMIFSNWPQLLGLAGLGTFANVLFFRGLEGESVSNVEPFIIFKPLAAILIASLAFPSERSLVIYLTIIASALILAWAHFSNKKIKLSSELLSIMGFWGVYGVELIFVNNLLDVFTPIELYLIRCAFVFVALTIVSRPNFSIMRWNHIPYSIMLGALAVLAVVAIYTSFQQIGLASSMLVMVISPILVYWFSAHLLKEKWSNKNIISSVLIVLLVVIASWINAQ